LLSQLAARPMRLGRFVIRPASDDDKRGIGIEGLPNTSGHTRLSRSAVARRPPMTSGALGAVTPIGAADASDAPSSKRFLGVCAGVKGEDEDGRATTSRKESK
jgi:hypothetical protein